jgi:replicative DNA helicase
MAETKKNTRKKLFEPSPHEMGKMQPQAVELEEAVLGAALLESDATFLVTSILKPEHFYKEENGLIYTALLELTKKGEPIDLRTVCQELKRQGNFELVGGSFAVASLTDKIASSANIEYHARIVIQKSIMRETIRFGTELIKKAYEDSTDCFELVDWAGVEISNIISGLETKKARLIEDVKNDVINDCKDSLIKEQVKGVPISLTKVQEHTNGWQNGHFIILAARPGMGKTALALDFAIHPAMEKKEPTAIFSLEMTQKELAARLMSKHSHISSKKILNGSTDTDELSAVIRDSVVLNGIPFYIDDTPSLSITQLRSKAIRMVEQLGVKLIVIDYLQLMDGADEGNFNREQEISKITRGLKKLARELNIPIIALSQMSRQVESRASTGFRPMLADLRESGSIEQDADMVMFILRPEYYGLRMYKINGVDESTNRMMLLIIAKYRGGALADIKIRWNGSTTSVEDWDRVEQVVDNIQSTLDLGTAPRDFSQPTNKNDNDDLPF